MRRIPRQYLLDSIERFVIDEGSVDTNQVCAEFNLHPRIAQKWLALLRTENRLKSVRVPNIGTRSMPHVWMLPDDENLSDAVRKLVDEAARPKSAASVRGDGEPLVLRTPAAEWPRGAVSRDPMVAALFGTPAVTTLVS